MIGECPTSKVRSWPCLSKFNKLWISSSNSFHPISQAKLNFLLRTEQLLFIGKKFLTIRYLSNFICFLTRKIEWLPVFQLYRNLFSTNLVIPAYSFFSNPSEVFEKMKLLHLETLHKFSTHLIILSFDSTSSTENYRSLKEKSIPKARLQYSLQLSRDTRQFRIIQFIINATRRRLFHPARATT